jgi:hypothetical protein
VKRKIAEQSGLSSFERHLPKSMLPLNNALYERALSLLELDLIEMELRSLRFPEEQAKQRAVQVEEAIQVMEETRVQLPPRSLGVLSAFAGRGTLPFALASSSSVFSVDKVTKETQPHGQTTDAIKALIANKTRATP